MAPENGIWCCYVHGKLIDSARGSEYSALDLQAHKRLHEARKAAELRGFVADAFGLVDSVSIRSAPASLSGRTFELGMRNFITGPNNSGKTILAELIGSVAYPHLIARMSRDSDVDMVVRWFDPQTRHVRMSGRSGDLRQVYDGREVPYVPRPFKTVMISSYATQRIDLRSLAQVLDLSATAMKAALGNLMTLDGPIKEVKVDGDEIEFVAVVGGRTRRASPQSPESPALNGLFLLEVAAAHAGFHASVEPTILLLDEPEIWLHPQVEIEALERLSRSCGRAQLAVITHSPVALAALSDWNTLTLGGPTPASLHGAAPVDITIESKSTMPKALEPDTAD